MCPADAIPIPEPFNGPRPSDIEFHIRKVADCVHRLNLYITHAVEAGATIELMRGSRAHNGRGQWGDQMIPIVKLPEPKSDRG